MAFIELIKEIFGSRRAAFNKLLVPNYFLSQKAKMNTEEYAKWLRKQYAYYGSMAYSHKYKGLFMPTSWIDGLRLIEDEIENVKKQDTSHIFTTDGKKISEELKAL